MFPELSAAQEVIDLTSRYVQLTGEIKEWTSKLVGIVTEIEEDVAIAEAGFYWGTNERAKAFAARIVILEEERKV